MSSAPPGNNDKRGPGGPSHAAPDVESEPSSDSLDGEIPASEAVDEEGWLVEARTADAAADAAFFEAEAAATPQESARVGPLVFEAAWLRESVLGRERDAARSYAQAVTADPSFAPGTWSLRRMFRERALWENLLRVCDAELKFGTWARASDRADLQVERGRILEDRLNRDGDALESYRAGLTTAPQHLAASWSILLHALRIGADTEVEATLTALQKQATEPLPRAILAIELARLQNRMGEDGLMKAADTLFRALSASAEVTPLLAEADRLTLGSDKVDLRLRFLDAFESRIGRDLLQEVGQGRSVAEHPALTAAVGHFREKARMLLRRGAKDAALSVVERALTICPGHPLAWIDYLDLAEEAGKADAVEAMAGTVDAGSEAAAEALLRKAEMVERAGALGEAVRTLERISRETEVAPLATLARARVLARLQDGEGLANAFGELAAGLAKGDENERSEAAHFFVRAGLTRMRALGDSTGAEPLFRRALEMVPEHRPGAAGLATALAALGRFDELAAHLESEERREQHTHRRQALLEALLRLERDVRTDGARARRWQVELLKDREDDRAHVRYADVAGLAGAADAATSLGWLAERTRAPRVAAGLKLLAARLLGDGAPESEALLGQALAQDPASLAGPAIERLRAARGDVAGQLEVLSSELETAERGGRSEVARALRFRLSHVAARAGRLPEALAQLEPLRTGGDRLADAYSLELARRAHNAELEAKLLREGINRVDGDGASELDSAFERSWALAEAVERTGNRAAAAAAYRDTSARAANADPGRWADVELGILRAELGQGRTVEAVASLRRLALFLEGEPAAVARREAALWALTASVPSDDEPGSGPADGVWQWLRGVRTGDLMEVVRGLERVAGDTSDEAAASLWLSVAVRKGLIGDAGAGEAFGLAARGEASAAVMVAATDLAGPGALPVPVASWRRTRAERLRHGSPAERRLAQALLIEEALEAEAAGRPVEAAQACTDVLAVADDVIEAVEVLRRLAHESGDRRAEAAALARKGALTASAQRSAEAFAEAALLLETEGARDEAAPLFVRLLERVPEDDEAYRRLHEILAQRDDAAGLARLVGFKLQHTVDAEARLALYQERARLRLDRLDERAGAVQDFKRSLKINPQHGESLRELGRLALEARQGDAAVRFLTRAIDVEPDEGARGPLRLQLAAGYEMAQDMDGAEQSLRTAIEADPQAAAPRERMVELATRQERHDVARAQLAALAELALDAVGRAAVLVRIGRLERDHRRIPSAAVKSFRAALEADPLSDAAGELRTTLAGAAPGDEERPVIERAFEEVRRGVIADDTFAKRRLEQLRDLARLRGSPDLAEVAEQLLAAADGRSAEKPARDPTRPLGAESFAALLGRGEEGGPGAGVLVWTEIWNQIGGAVGRIEGLEAGKLGASRQTKVTLASQPWVEASRVVIGLGEFTVHVLPTAGRTVTALDAPEPTLVIERGILGGGAAARFAVARALFLLRCRAATLDRIPASQVDEMLRAAIVASGATRPECDPMTLKPRVKALTKALSRRELKELETLRPQLQSVPLDGVAWQAVVRRAADRYGLLVAGDLGPCLRVLVGAEALTAHHLRRGEALELLRFALDDRHARLRGELGLGDAD